MKAICVNEFGGPEVLKLQEVPTPEAGSGQALIRVKAAGVNPYDTYMRSGNYGARNPKLPFTPGSDAAGIVESIGPDVEGISPGDRAYTTGTLTGAYAEYALCGRNQLHPLPLNLSFSQGAGLWVPYGTSYRAIFQLAKTNPGERLLIHGASGGVGTAAIQWARAAGIEVFGTAGSARGIELIKAEGASHAFNHHDPNYQEEILSATKGAGIDVILEMLANVNLGNDLKMLARRGRVVVIGSRGDVQITPRDLMSRQAAILGMALWDAPENEAAMIHAAMYAGLEVGTLKPVVGADFPLSAAADAHKKIMEPGASGKVVLLP